MRTGKYRKDAETDLVKHAGHHGYIDNGEDHEPDADSQGHMVQCPGHPTAPLRPHLVSNMVGFTG